MLKEYRLKKKISQEELEKITNLDRKTIFRIENDLNTPLLDNFGIVEDYQMKKLVKKLGILLRKKGEIIMNNVIITLRTDIEIKKKLDNLALEDHRSLNNYINLILIKHLENIKNETKESK